MIKKHLIVLGLCMMLLGSGLTACGEAQKSSETGTVEMVTEEAAKSQAPVGDKSPVEGTEADKTVSEDMVRMTAVVKEIKEDCLLVSSRTDEQPGAYYVYFGDLDVSWMKGGDEIIISWNGDVLETDPAQIYAEALERK